MTALEILSLSFVPFVPDIRNSVGRVRRVGVYILARDTTIVYVGSSIDMDFRFRSHAARRHLGGFAFNIHLWLEVAKVDRFAYEGALIRALGPIYNRQSPTFRGRDNEILEELGLRTHKPDTDIAAEWTGYIRRHRSRTA